MRATDFWTEETAALLKNHFVAVAVNGMAMNNRQDADKMFLYDICKLRLAGAGGNIIVVTAHGKQLGGTNGVSSNLKKAWAEWQALPEAERKPGAVQVEADARVDPVEGPAAPPPGALIVKLHYRALTRDGGRGFRYARTDDFPSKHWSLKSSYWYEAAPDFLWIMEREWKCLLRDKPLPGDKFALPKPIKDRIFQFHLVPTMTFGESNGWSPGGKQVRAGEMNLIVEEATPARVRLRLEGFAHLGAAYDEAVTQKPNWEKSGGLGYEPRLHGYLEYDPKTKTLTRFDLLALGDTYGTLGGDLRYFYRPGRQPLGVAFELVSSELPAHRVPPLGFRQREMKPLRYLGAEP